MYSRERNIARLAMAQKHPMVVMLTDRDDIQTQIRLWCSYSACRSTVDLAKFSLRLPDDMKIRGYRRQTWM